VLINTNPHASRNVSQLKSVSIPTENKHVNIEAFTIECFRLDTVVIDEVATLRLPGN
jgi:hypothetical protein